MPSFYFYLLLFVIPDIILPMSPHYEDMRMLRPLLQVHTILILEGLMRLPSSGEGLHPLLRSLRPPPPSSSINYTHADLSHSHYPQPRLAFIALP